MSVFGDQAAAPMTTGSIPAAPVQVQGPLPPSLAYSDATKIGQAATAALLQANGNQGEWINNSTGSSGTIEPTVQMADAGSCQPFSTTVTSIGGVHQYSGAVCQQTSGRPIVQIDERSPDDRT